MLVANVTKKKQSDNFNIVTPTVIAGVRGTRFLVEVIPNSSNLSVTRVSVLDGSVGITKHKDEIPVSAEPIEILDGKQTAIEMASGGEFKNLLSMILTQKLLKAVKVKKIQMLLEQLVKQKKAYMLNMVDWKFFLLMEEVRLQA